MSEGGGRGGQRGRGREGGGAMAGAKSAASRMHGVLNCEGHSIPSYENEGGGGDSSAEKRE